LTATTKDPLGTRNEKFSTAMDDNRINILFGNLSTRGRAIMPNHKVTFRELNVDRICA